MFSYLSFFKSVLGYVNFFCNICDYQRNTTVGELPDSQKCIITVYVTSEAYIFNVHTTHKFAPPPYRNYSSYEIKKRQFM
jgi:hypothetical protein